MEIKTIIFDQWGVIIGHDNDGLYQKLSKFSPLGKEEFREMVKNSDLFEKYDKGEMEPEKFWEEMSNLTGMEIGFERFNKVFSLHANRKREMEKLVKELSEDYELFLLSSTNRLHQKLAERICPALGHFDEKILSFEVGKRKPDPEIFKIALDKTDSRPEECVFTDDIEEYVRAAEKLGMKGIVFRNKEQFMEELKSLGVKWGAH